MIKKKSIRRIREVIQRLRHLFCMHLNLAPSPTLYMVSWACLSIELVVSPEHCTVWPLPNNRSSTLDKDQSLGELSPVPLVSWKIVKSSFLALGTWSSWEVLQTSIAGSSVTSPGLLSLLGIWLLCGELGMERQKGGSPGALLFLLCLRNHCGIHLLSTVSSHLLQLVIRVDN